jgi:hypothetical protein
MTSKVRQAEDKKIEKMNQSMDLSRLNAQNSLNDGKKS